MIISIESVLFPVFPYIYIYIYIYVCVCVCVYVCICVRGHKGGSTSVKPGVLPLI